MQRFEDDIDAVVAETCEMAKLSTEMLERAIQAVTDGDVDLADSIIADQAKIEKFDDEIEGAAIRILTLYQPTAVDTRTVATILKSITHLERIAKYSTTSRPPPSTWPTSPRTRSSTLSSPWARWPSAW